jgi:uncharacterized protein (DUF2062 family)
MDTGNNKWNNKRHPLVRLKRWARLSYLKIIRMDDPPERIARGAALGVLCGVLPTFGAGGVIALAAAFVFRANKAAAVLGSLIMNPITTPFFWTLSVVLGSAILGEDSSSILTAIREESLMDGLTLAYLAFLTGNAIIAVVFTSGTYYLTKNAIIKHREHKARKRQKKAAL